MYVLFLCLGTWKDNPVTGGRKGKLHLQKVSTRWSLYFQASHFCFEGINCEVHGDLSVGKCILGNRSDIEREVSRYWVGCVGDKVGNSYMEMDGKGVILEGILVRRVVGALEVSK